MYEKVQRALSGFQVYLEDLDEEIIWSGKLMEIQTMMFCICVFISGLAAWSIFRQSLQMDLIKNKKEYLYIEAADPEFADFYRRISRYRKTRFFLTGVLWGAVIYVCSPIMLAMLTIS